MRKLYFLLPFIGFLLSCKEKTTAPAGAQRIQGSLEITHAKGFRITAFEEHTMLTITNPWPGAEKEFKYALVKRGTSIPASESYDALIEIPVQEIVVTSTTHIPSLEMLGVSEALVGFPNLDYISSEITRKRIDDGKVTELGRNEDLNTEVLINLAPDVVITFAVEGDNKTIATIQKTGIPVVYNADWTETTPLGKAEWIKFFGVFFGKEREADSIFNYIETQYAAARKLAKQANEKPTVLSGAMYKDVWYLPQGDSWAAQFIADANGDYIWKDTAGTGSLSLNLEAVLEKGQEAAYWIGPSQFTSLEQLRKAHSVYPRFKAFQNSRVFSFTNKKGATGGVLYYELAPNRPDIVLKDIIKILHPDLLPNHELFFFSQLK